MIKKKQQNVILVNKINNSISTTNIIKTNQYILISISGGQDSICMFFILLQLQKQWKWTFGVIFCNHLWQKNTFFINSLVLQLAYLFKIPTYCLVTPNKIFSEQKSRYWRYNIFYRISFFYNYTIITTGHTSSDKVETILFQFLRGSSTKNFSSLNFLKNFLCINNFTKTIKNNTHYLYNLIKINLTKINLQLLFIANKIKQFQKFKLYKVFHENYYFFTKSVTTSELPFSLCQTKGVKKTFLLQAESTFLLLRPMLKLHRFDLQKLVNFWNLPLYPDKSNRKSYFYRNRIRNQLLPVLRFFFNPQIDTMLLQFAKIITAEEIYLEFLATRLSYEFPFGFCQTKSEQGHSHSHRQDYGYNCGQRQNQIFKLNISLFYSIPIAIQRKLIKKYLINSNFKKIYFSQIEYIRHIILKKKFLLFKNYLIKQKNLQKNYLNLLYLNSTLISLIQKNWIQFRDKKKEKVNILNIFLKNIKIYISITLKKKLFFNQFKLHSKKYLKFFKKQFFLMAIIKIIRFFNLCQTKSEQGHNHSHSHSKDYDCGQRKNFYKNSIFLTDLTHILYNYKNNNAKNFFVSNTITYSASKYFDALTSSCFTSKYKFKHSSNLSQVQTTGKKNKKNIFNFKKLIAKTNLSKNQMQCKSFIFFYDKLIEFNFLHQKKFFFYYYIYYFQKFEIFFYPKTGIFIYLNNTLILFKN